jgi:hypothetical protein
MLGARFVMSVVDGGCNFQCFAELDAVEIAL